MKAQQDSKKWREKFRTNFRRLKDFMTAVDKEIAQMAVFKQNEVDGTNEYAPPDNFDENL